MQIEKANVPYPRARHLGIGWAAALVLVLPFGGCDILPFQTIEPRGLGNPCTVANGDVQGPTKLVVGPDPMNCSSNVCLRPEMRVTTDTGSLCAQGCETDLDCQGGELRNLEDPADRRCRTRFSCEVPIPNLASVSLACQKMCVCHDFLGSSPQSKPPSCP